MHRKTYVLDVNVLLHDPRAMMSFVGNDVLIPVFVLDELRYMMRHTDELGRNAREAMGIIDALAHRGDIQNGVPIENEIVVKVLLDIHHRTDERDFPLNLDKPFHRVLFAMRELKKKGTHQIVLVSKELVSRVKAQALGIHAEDYRGLKKSYKELYRGIPSISVERGVIDQLFKEGSVALQGQSLESNEYAHFKASEDHHALVRYDGRSRRFVSLGGFPKSVWGLTPCNIEQQVALDLLLRDDIRLVGLVGQAGTGKTLLALACGLLKVFDERLYKKILVSRPMQVFAQKDIGYLPGDKVDKISPWMQPIFDNIEYLCDSAHQMHEDRAKEVKQYLLDSGRIELEALTFMRGRSLSNAWIIIDEAQNMNHHEMKTVLTRAGKNTKIILTGDPHQIDNPLLDSDSNGLTYAAWKLRSNPLCGFVFLTQTERSELARIVAETF